jgi:hypothetical protein
MKGWVIIGCLFDITGNHVDLCRCTVEPRVSENWIFQLPHVRPGVSTT